MNEGSIFSYMVVTMSFWMIGVKAPFCHKFFLYDYVNRGHVCPCLVESDLKKR